MPMCVRTSFRFARMSVMSRSSKHTWPVVGSSSMLDAAQQGRLAPAGGADDHDDVALVHRQVHALEDVQVPEPLVDALQADQRLPAPWVADGGRGRLRHPPAPAIPTSPLRSRFSAAFTSRISGSVTIR